MSNESLSPVKSNVQVDTTGEPVVLPAQKVRRRFEGLSTVDGQGRPGYFLHYTAILGDEETPVFEKIEDKQGLAMVDDWVHGKGVFAPRKFVPRSPEGVGAPR